MSLVPFAPAAAPAPVASAPNAPARASQELGAVFSALVDALTEEFLPAEESSSAGQPVTDVALLGAEATEVDPTATDAAAVVALLLGATAPAEPTAPAPVDGTLDGAAPTAAPPSDQITPDATISDPTDVVPDSDVDPAVGGEADGPVETAATLEAAVDAGPVPPPSDTADDSAAPIGFDTVEPGTPETAPTDEGADAPVEVLPSTDQGDAVELAPVTTPSDESDDPAGEPADGDAAGADRTTLEGSTAEGPDVGGVETAHARPATPGPGPEATATAPVFGSTASAPTAPAHAVASAATPADPTPPALPDQLVTVLEPLRRAPDGTHRVAMQLRPDELGEVQIDVQVRGNEISLSVRADLPGTVDLLRASVAELRAQLEAAGFQAGDLDVTGHSADGAADDRGAGDTDGATTDRTAGSSTGTDEAADAPPAPLSATGLDLRL